jgi:hypothetical protein
LRPDAYKVSATYRDGFRSAGTLTIIGRDAVAKARRCGELVLQRVRDAGFELRDSVVECLGSGDGAAGVVHPQNAGAKNLGETVLRVAVETNSHAAAERFSRELMPLITAGPQGTTGYTEGRPRVHPVYRYWPCLIRRDAVTPHVEVLCTPEASQTASPGGHRATTTKMPFPLRPVGIAAIEQPPSNIQHPASSTQHLTSSIQYPSHLYDIAVARSGDKGTSANVGVIARSRGWWEFLQSWLTAERVASFFAPSGIESVERFELPNLQALNFELRGALRQSLRTDAQGKAFGQILLEMPLPSPLVLS